MADSERLGPSPEVSVEELRFVDPEFQAKMRGIVGIYTDPKVRFHLMEPPLSLSEIVREHAYGSTVYCATDTSGKLTGTPHQVVGAVTLKPLEVASLGSLRIEDASRVEIARIAVAPAVARRGVGRRMLRHAVDTIFAGTAEDILLGILGDVPGGEGMTKFFSKEGFMERPWHSAVVPIRDLGTVADLQHPPFPGVGFASDLQGDAHFVSRNVPLHVMGLSRRVYTKLQGGRP